MTTMKHSKQRDCILTCLRGRYDHPTADMIFEQVKVMVPNISLGTVYRNLALLASVGEISRIPVLDGADRFDAVTEPHYHVICRSCGSVEDLTLPVDPKLNQKASRVYEGRILSHEICFQGICKKCLENP